jgi:hypothetical protein
MIWCLRVLGCVKATHSAHRGCVPFQSLVNATAPQHQQIPDQAFSILSSKFRANFKVAKNAFGFKCSSDKAIGIISVFVLCSNICQFRTKSLITPLPARTEINKYLHIFHFSSQRISFRVFCLMPVVLNACEHSECTSIRQTRIVEIPISIRRVNMEGSPHGRGIRFRDQCIWLACTGLAVHGVR